MDICYGVAHLYEEIEAEEVDLEGFVFLRRDPGGRGL